MRTCPSASRRKCTEQRCQGPAEHLRDCLLQAGVGVGDDQLDAREAALDERAQEAAPEGLRLALPDIEGDHLPVARLVDAIGEHERLAHNAATIADLLDLRIEPEVGVAALERAVAEGVDLLVQTLADARDLALRDPEPERLDHLIDLARGDAGDIGLLHRAHERLLRAAARLEEARKVAAAPQLRDGELELAGTGVPRPRTVAVAMREPLLGYSLAAGGTDELRHLRLHQLLADPGQRFAQEVEPLPLEQVADDLISRHPLRLGHRGAPFVDPWQEPTSLSATVAGPLPGSVRCAPTPRYGT